MCQEIWTGICQHLKPDWNRTLFFSSQIIKRKDAIWLAETTVATRPSTLPAIFSAQSVKNGKAMNGPVGNTFLKIWAHSSWPFSVVHFAVQKRDAQSDFYDFGRNCQTHFYLAKGKNHQTEINFPNTTRKSIEKKTTITTGMNELWILVKVEIQNSSRMKQMKINKLTNSI